MGQSFSYDHNYKQVDQLAVKITHECEVSWFELVEIAKDNKIRFEGRR